MIDAYIRPLIDPPLTKMGASLAKRNISANAVTLVGFVFGLAAMGAIALGKYERRHILRHGQRES